MEKKVKEMAWIESHQEIGRHPKTKRGARQLNITIPTMVGHLHLFWHWCLDFAKDGNLGGHSEEDIADAAQWEGQAPEFTAALLSAGFLLKDDNGNYIVNDWYDYGGKLIAQRKASAERVKKWRGKQGDEPLQEAERVTKPLRNANVQKCNLLTEQDITEQDITEDSSNTQMLGIPFAGAADETGEEKDESKVEAKNPRAPRFNEKHGEALYMAYPRKTNRREGIAAAVRALARIASGKDQPEWFKEKWPPPDPLSWLLDRVSRYAQSVKGQPPLSVEDDYRPHPATWFNQGKYCDDEAEWNRGKLTDERPPNPNNRATQRDAEDAKLRQRLRDAQEALNGA